MLGICTGAVFRSLAAEGRPRRSETETWTHDDSETRQIHSTRDWSRHESVDAVYSCKTTSVASSILLRQAIK